MKIVIVKNEEMETIKVPEYDDNKVTVDGVDIYDTTYNKGDYVLYNNVVYQCNSYDVKGEFDSDYWTETTLSAEFNLFEDKFKSGGDYEDYEIVSVSWTGVAALFVLKEKVA